MPKNQLVSAQDQIMAEYLLLLIVFRFCVLIFGEALNDCH